MKDRIRWLKPNNNGEVHIKQSNIKLVDLSKKNALIVLENGKIYKIKSDVTIIFDSKKIKVGEFKM